MQTDAGLHEYPDYAPSPVRLNYLVHTLAAYWRPIFVAVVAVALTYAIGANAYFLSRQGASVTTQNVQLEFRGATEGTYPNGARFNPNDIVAVPILENVYRANHIHQFLPFTDFSHSFFVVSSNPSYDALVNDYQARLADPRLTPIDRERIEQEFASKRQSIASNLYSLNYAVVGHGKLPSAIAQKCVLDVLAEWARRAIQEQRVLQYDVAVLSPSLVDDSLSGTTDPMIATWTLRSVVVQAAENAKVLKDLPSADLARTKSGTSLKDVESRLENIARFRLEPLLGSVWSSGLAEQPPLAMNFIETQLLFDQRRLESAKADAESIRQALAAYTNVNVVPSNTARDAADANAQKGSPQQRVTTEMVQPVLGDNFLDRLTAMISRGDDPKFRQRLIEQYRKAQDAIIDPQQDVAFDSQILAQLQQKPAGARLTAAEVQAQLQQSATMTRDLIGQMQQLMTVLSANLNPSAELFTQVGPISTRYERPVSYARLMVYGLAIIMATLLISAAAALIHRRIVEEDAEDAALNEAV